MRQQVCPLNRLNDVSNVANFVVFSPSLARLVYKELEVGGCLSALSTLLDTTKEGLQNVDELVFVGPSQVSNREPVGLNFS